MACARFHFSNWQNRFKLEKLHIALEKSQKINKRRATFIPDSRVNNVDYI